MLQPNGKQLFEVPSVVLSVLGATIVSALPEAVIIMATRTIRDALIVPFMRKSSKYALISRVTGRNVANLLHMATEPEVAVLSVHR